MHVAWEVTLVVGISIRQSIASFSESDILIRELMEECTMLRIRAHAFSKSCTDFGRFDETPSAAVAGKNISSSSRKFLSSSF
jgi:hypothetical protein